MLGGAVPILVANPIGEHFGSQAIGLYLACLAALSTACVLALHETAGADMAVAGSIPRGARLGDPATRC